MEIQQVYGMSKSMALRVQAAIELGRRMDQLEMQDLPYITGPQDAADLLMPTMSYLEQEEVRVISLNTRHKVMSIDTIYIGNAQSAIIRPSELFRPAIRQNATGIILSHNHPSGDPSPSPEDVHVTRSILDASNLLGIELVDHLVIGRKSFCSMKELRMAFG